MFKLSLTFSELFLFRRFVELFLSTDQRQLISLVLFLVFKVLQNGIDVVSTLSHSRPIVL